MEKIITYSIVFLVIFYCVYLGIVHINNSMIFLPEDIGPNDYDNFCDEHKDNYIPYKFWSDDGKHKLAGGLYNFNKKPSWDDQIFFYSHGNHGWIGSVIKNNKLLELLSTHGSIFVYDYRGYGCNEGHPTDVGLESDALGAWNFIANFTNQKSTIVVGHSLGCGVSCRMLTKLLEIDPEGLPRYLLLSSPFSSVKDMAYHRLPKLAWLTVYEFDNYHNLQKLDKYLDICIVHSKEDDVIPFLQAKKLQNVVDCVFFESYGKHNDHHYGEDVLEYVHKISRH